MSEDLAILRVSPLRRLIGIGTTVGLGGLLIYLAGMHAPMAPGWRVFLLAVGIGVLAVAEAMRRATGRALHLTREGLFDSAGREVAAIGRIARVDRGIGALKPSNGFALELNARAPRAWAPGVWWRIGRRVGVGGVTSAAQAKAMADILALMLRERDGGSCGSPRGD